MLSLSISDNLQQSGFNLPLLVNKNIELAKSSSKHHLVLQAPVIPKPADKKQIELAVCLYDFQPQKAGDLGFKAGERILIESRKDSDNWWFGSIGTRKGWFPKNYIELKTVS